jgi:hypothetical protein
MPQGGGSVRAPCCNCYNNDTKLEYGKKVKATWYMVEKQQTNVWNMEMHGICNEQPI